MKDEWKFWKLYDDVSRLLVFSVCTVSWAALFSGWAIGGWGGVVAMSSFLEKFFPAINGGDSLYDSKTTPSEDGDVLDYETDGNTNLYCIFNDNVLTLTGSILYAAACPAVLLASIVTHRYGRKSTLWVIASLSMMSAIIGSSAENIAMVFACRIFAGMAMGLGFQAPVMYIAEISPRSHRGGFIFLYNLVMYVGATIAPIVNKAVSTSSWGWRFSIAMYGFPGLILSISLLFVPESPNSLIQRGHETLGKKALHKLRSESNASGTQIELDSILEVVAKERGLEKSNNNLCLGVHMEIFRKKYIPSLIVSIAYPIVNMFAGMNVIGTWSPQLFIAFGASISYAFTASIIVNIVGLVGTIIAALLIDRVGRRVLLLFGGILTAVSLATCSILLAIYLPTGDSPSGASFLIAVMTILLCIYRLFLSMSLHPLSLTVPTEIQPLAIRSTASSITTIFRNGSSFIIVQFALPLLCALKWGLYILFAIVAFIGTLVLVAITPETKGEMLENIDKLWSKHWLWRRISTVNERTKESIEVQ